MATVVLRTNYMCDSLQRMLDLLEGAGLNILLAADFTATPFDTRGFDFFEVSREILKANGLFVGIPDPIWQCGDYVLYLALENRPHEEIFWHIESDVRFNMDNPAKFFDRVHESGLDCSLVSFVKSTEDWHWYFGTSQQHLEVYRCRFPVVFSKRAAVDFAFRLRVEQSVGMLIKLESPEYAKALAYNRTLWPNDEGFFASAAKAGGFIVGDINSQGQVYSSETFRYEPAFLEDDFARLKPDNKIYHPVLEFENWVKKSLRHKRPEALAKFEAEIPRLCDIGYPYDEIVRLKTLYW